MTYYVLLTVTVDSVVEWSKANAWVESKIDPLLGEQTGGGFEVTYNGPGRCSSPTVCDWKWETDDLEAVRMAALLVTKMGGSWELSFEEFTDEVDFDDDIPNDDLEYDPDDDKG